METAVEDRVIRELAKSSHFDNVRTCFQYEEDSCGQSTCGWKGAVENDLASEMLIKNRIKEKKDRES